MAEGESAMSAASLRVKQINPHRPLVDIIQDLSKRIPEHLLSTVPPKWFEAQRQARDRETRECRKRHYPLDLLPYDVPAKYIPWYNAVRVLNHYAPGWVGEIRNIAVPGKHANTFVTVVYRITLKGSDGEVCREASATSTMDYSDHSVYFSPVQNAEREAFSKACLLFGLGLYLYHSPDAPPFDSSNPDECRGCWSVGTSGSDDCISTDEDEDTDAIDSGTSEDTISTGDDDDDDDDDTQTIGSGRSGEASITASDNDLEAGRKYPRPRRKQKQKLGHSEDEYTSEDSEDDLSEDDEEGTGRSSNFAEAESKQSLFHSAPFLSQLLPSTFVKHEVSQVPRATFLFPEGTWMPSTFSKLTTSQLSAHGKQHKKLKKAMRGLRKARKASMKPEKVAVLGGEDEQQAMEWSLLNLTPGILCLESSGVTPSTAGLETLGGKACLQQGVETAGADPSSSADVAKPAVEQENRGTETQHDRTISRSQKGTPRQKKGLSLSPKLDRRVQQLHSETLKPKREKKPSVHNFPTTSVGVTSSTSSSVNIKNAAADLESSGQETDVDMGPSRSKVERLRELEKKAPVKGNGKSPRGTVHHTKEKKKNSDEGVSITQGEASSVDLENIIGKTESRVDGEQVVNEDPEVVGNTPPIASQGLNSKKNRALQQPDKLRRRIQKDSKGMSRSKSGKDKGSDRRFETSGRVLPSAAASKSVATPPSSATWKHTFVTKLGVAFAPSASLETSGIQGRTTRGKTGVQVSEDIPEESISNSSKGTAQQKKLRKLYLVEDPKAVDGVEPMGMGVETTRESPQVSTRLQTAEGWPSSSTLGNIDVSTVSKDYAFDADVIFLQPQLRTSRARKGIQMPEEDPEANVSEGSQFEDLKTVGGVESEGIAVETRIEITQAGLRPLPVGANLPSLSPGKSSLWPLRLDIADDADVVLLRPQVKNTRIDKGIQVSEEAIEVKGRWDNVQQNEEKEKQIEDLRILEGDGVEPTSIGVENPANIEHILPRLPSTGVQPSRLSSGDDDVISFDLDSSSNSDVAPRPSRERATRGRKGAQLTQNTSGDLKGFRELGYSSDSDVTLLSTLERTTGEMKSSKVSKESHGGRVSKGSRKIVGQKAEEWQHLVEVLDYSSDSDAVPMPSLGRTTKEMRSSKASKVSRGGRVSKGFRKIIGHKEGEGQHSVEVLDYSSESDVTTLRTWKKTVREKKGAQLSKTYTGEMSSKVSRESDGEKKQPSQQSVEVVDYSSDSAVITFPIWKRISGEKKGDGSFKESTGEIVSKVSWESGWRKMEPEQQSMEVLDYSSDSDVTTSRTWKKTARKKKRAGLSKDSQAEDVSKTIGHSKEPKQQSVEVVDHSSHLPTLQAWNHTIGVMKGAGSHKESPRETLSKGFRKTIVQKRGPEHHFVKVLDYSSDSDVTTLQTWKKILREKKKGAISSKGSAREIVFKGLRDTVIEKKEPNHQSPEIVDYSSDSEVTTSQTWKRTTNEEIGAELSKESLGEIISKSLSEIGDQKMEPNEQSMEVGDSSSASDETTVRTLERTTTDVGIALSHVTITCEYNERDFFVQETRIG